VAYVSDRSGSRQVWLQQVAGGEPIQLSHSPDPVLGVSFFPDGSQLAYAANSTDGRKGTLTVIPTLGGEPRVVLSTGQLILGAIAPDGRRGAYFDYDPSSPASRIRLVLASFGGGAPREPPRGAPRLTRPGRFGG
jgi:Tol biopolymer transport system component